MPRKKRTVAKSEVVFARKLKFKERCDVCGEATEDFKTFYDEKEEPHIICRSCISIIKSLSST